jgi:hypothetical protein
MKLVNRDMAGQKFSTAVGMIVCDDEGCCECSDESVIAVLMGAGFKEVAVKKQLPKPAKSAPAKPAPAPMKSALKAEKSEKARR